MSWTLRHSLSPNSPLLTKLLQRISSCFLYPDNAASLLYSAASHTTPHVLTVLAASTALLARIQQPIT